ncbi:hypothetical protein K7432_009123 [Basidiobolus ranarum]|uniref:Uncharacterized protein n=1 Tax=Basidiobolus ranarum TaxID=34480 RepID=A0ABR2VYB6_9FUNG
MSGPDDTLRSEPSSTFISRLDYKIKAYRQELEAVKVYHQTPKGSTSNKIGDITKTSRASPSALSESFEKLTLNEPQPAPSEKGSESEHSMNSVVPYSEPQLHKHASSSLSIENLDAEIYQESEDAEEIDPMYLQPYNEYTDQYDVEDGDHNPDDNDSLCNSIQYSEHTHILDVEPPTFSVYGDESVYEAPFSDSTITRRRSLGLHRSQLLNRASESTRYGLKNCDDTIYEDDYLDRTYMSVPPSEAHGYRSTPQKGDGSNHRLDSKHYSPFVDEETNGRGYYQDEFESVSSRRSSSHYDGNYQLLNRTEPEYLGRSAYHDTGKGYNHDDPQVCEERSRVDLDSSRDLYNIDNYKDRGFSRYDNSSLGQSYSLRDDISSREGSVDTSIHYSPRYEDHSLSRRSLINTSAPSSPNLRFQHGRYSLLDRCDSDTLRRSRSSLSDFVSNSTYSPVTSPRDTGYRTSPRLPEVRRIPRVHSPIAGSPHTTRSLISERTTRRNRYTISNPGDLRSEQRSEFRNSRSDVRPSSRLSIGTQSVHAPLSDTTSHSAGADVRSRKLNEVKFEIFRAVHRVKMALDSLAEDSRTRSITSEIQGIQDLNELALQTMIEQFEHVHEMLGEGEGSVGVRRPISPLSDESYGKLIPNDTKKFGIVEESSYGRQGLSEETSSSGYTKSNVSSPNLYSHRFSQTSRFDRNSFAEPPLSPSPSRISKWQSLIEDSKNSNLLASRLRSTTSTYDG